MLQTRRPALSGNALKGIAILAMTLDHLTWTLWPGYSTAWWVLLLHLLGRVTAPIMWFFVVEGYHYTHDVEKYAVRLFALAVVSHFAYDFCFGIPFLPLSTGPFNQTGVVWSLAWGLMLLVIHDDARLKGWIKIVLTFVICAITFPSDWSCVAAMAILFMGQARGDFRRQMCWLMVWSAVYALVYFFFIDKIYALVQLGTALSIPLLRCYDGAIGVKTGYTKASGRTLVSCAQRGATRFVCVTLSDPDDWNDHTRLLDWAFENYAYRAVAGDAPVYAVPVLSGTVQVCAVTPEREAYLLLRPEDTVTLTAELPRFAFAPVQQGTRAGTLTATGPDGQSVSVALCYAEPAALDPDVKITPFARLGRLGTRVSRYFSAYYPEF